LINPKSKNKLTAPEADLIPHNNDVYIIPDIPASAEGVMRVADVPKLKAQV
jgi:hypothetical protein